MASSPVDIARAALKRFSETSRRKNVSDSEVELARKAASFYIDKLEEGPALHELEAIQYYDLGIWAMRTGKYDRAVHCLKESVRFSGLLNDLEAAANAGRCAEVSRCWWALSTGEPYNVATLTVISKMVVDLCHDSEDPKRQYWAFINAPVHVLLAYILTGTSIQGVEEQFWMGLYYKFMERDTPAFEEVLPTITAIEAGLLMLRGHPFYASAITLAFEARGHIQADDQARLTSDWVLARILWSIGDTGQAQEHVDALLREDHTMHHLRALAKRTFCK